MGLLIPVHRRIMVYRKTDYRCAICGKGKDLTCDHFIPKWTRIVGDEYENLIPLCEDCNSEKAMNFIELNRLEYLPTLFIDMLMRYYSDIAKYLKKYVRDYGSYRTNSELDVEHALLILGSYDEYIRHHDLNWEEL